MKRCKKYFRRKEKLSKLVKIMISGCLVLQMLLGTVLGESKRMLADTIVLNEMKEETVSEPDNLYARSCVLMDGTTGRVLFEKDGYNVMPMASTTKIMTLIVALENCNPQDVVTVSSYGAAQPKVHLGVHTGQQFVLNDLFYSLMLESHNDSAVIIAEYIGSKKLKLPPAEERTKEESKAAVKAFTDMMNEKARDIGCFDTYFITPNGLDAEVLLDNGEQKVHSTTAADLASILMYCITTSVEKETFLTITRTASYSFSDVKGTSSYQCSNHNAFLNMMEGALTGKTGFTNNAGYCYVGALERDGKLFIVALLACGWPNNKSYKWSDTKKLMEYGLSNYQYTQIYEKKTDFSPVPVEDGQAALGKTAYVQLKMEDNQLEILMNPKEQADVKFDLPRKLTAPVKEGEPVGSVKYSIDGKLLAVYPVYAKNSVNKKDYLWSLGLVWKMFVKNM